MSLGHDQSISCSQRLKGLVERGACIPSRARSGFGCEQSRRQASRKSERRAHGVRHTWLLARGEPQIDRSGRKAAQQSCTGVTRTGCQSRHPNRTPPPDHLMAPKPTRCRVCSRQSASCRSGRHDRGCSKQCVRRGEGGSRASRERAPFARASMGARQASSVQDRRGSTLTRRHACRKQVDHHLADGQRGHFGLKVQRDMASRLQGFLWRPMRPVWKLPA